MDAGPPTLAGLAHDGVGASVQAILASLDARPVCTGVTWGKAHKREPKRRRPAKEIYKSRDRVRTRGAHDEAPQPPEAFERLALRALLSSLITHSSRPRHGPRNHPRRHPRKGHRPRQPLRGPSGVLVVHAPVLHVRVPVVLGLRREVPTVLLIRVVRSDRARRRPVPPRPPIAARTRAP